MSKRVDVLAIAIVVALIYIGGVFFLQIRFDASTWVDGHKLNTLGDSIGGLTAPLALIFLVAAVVIQRQELAATKEELEKSSQALNQQVEEQKLNRDYMRQQTDLMRVQAEAAAENTRKTYKLSLFDRRFGVYFQVKNLRSEIVKEDTNWLEHTEVISDLNNQAQFLFGPDVSIWFAQMHEEIEKAAVLAEECKRCLKTVINGAGIQVEKYDEPYPSLKAALNTQRQNLLTALSDHVLYKVFSESMEVTD